MFPGKLLAYNCSPSFNWKLKLDERPIATFQQQLAAMGYKFQFITLAGFHALNHSMFELARDFEEPRHGRIRGAARQRVRERAARLHGHAPPAEVGTGYFDEVAQVVSEGKSSTTALTARPKPNSSTRRAFTNNALRAASVINWRCPEECDDVARERRAQSDALSL